MNPNYINLSEEERVALCVAKVNRVLEEFGCTVLPQVVSKTLDYGQETNTQTEKTRGDGVPENQVNKNDTAPKKKSKK